MRLDWPPFLFPCKGMLVRPTARPAFSIIQPQPRQQQPPYPTQLSPPIVLNQAGFEKGSAVSPFFFFLGQLIKITHKLGSPVMRGLLKRGSFRLLCLLRGILRLCQRNWNQMATQSGPPVRSAYGAISKDRAISSTSPLYRPQHPPGPTRCRDKCEQGGYISFTFQAAVSPQRWRLFNPVAATRGLTPPHLLFFFFLWRAP